MSEDVPSEDLHLYCYTWKGISHSLEEEEANRIEVICRSWCIVAWLYVWDNSGWTL
jgi:diacylglycerol kinase